MVTVHFARSTSGAFQTTPEMQFDGYKLLDAGCLKVWKGTDRRVYSPSAWEWIQLGKTG